MLKITNQHQLLTSCEGEFHLGALTHDNPIVSEYYKGKYLTQLKYSSRSVEELGLKQVKDCAIHEVKEV